MKHLILALLISFGVVSCRKKCPDNEQPITPTTYFEIRKDGKKLADSILRRTELFFVGNEGVKEYENANAVALGYRLFDIIYPQVENNTYDSSRPLLASSSLGSNSVVYQTKRFYFEYPDKSIDTFLVEHETIEEPGDHCRITRTFFKEIRHKGNKLIVDSSLMNQYSPVYIINK